MTAPVTAKPYNTSLARNGWRRTAPAEPMALITPTPHRAARIPCDNKKFHHGATLSHCSVRGWQPGRTTRTTRRGPARPGRTAQLLTPDRCTLHTLQGLWRPMASRPRRTLPLSHSASEPIGGGLGCQPSGSGGNNAHFRGSSSLARVK